MVQRNKNETCAEIVNGKGTLDNTSYSNYNYVIWVGNIFGT